ncbi:MAG: protein-L-isoaspartate(D-aspartate) O-methyltransferase [Sedimentisphaerales bacterium]|nr:protein-L-isoaspartate(D-aspartate) O-methyltransferase [Sedimentisphaerales bacterium]
MTCADTRRRRSRFLAALLVVAPVMLGVFGLAPGGCPAREPQDKAASADRTTQADKPAEAAGRNHPAFGEQREQRVEMVQWQIEARDVKDPNVLKAMRLVPRHAFVPTGQRAHAYADQPLPIGHGQTISQPYVVAFMTEALRLNRNSIVLEIGTGSGYQAAVAAEIAKEVYTIEIVEPLARSAAQLLDDLGYTNVHVKAGDGYYGWPEKGPFDAIIGTAAAERIPRPLIEQLRNGGRMILPVESTLGFQHLILITKDERGEIHQEKVMPVLFVPMTGEVQRPDRLEF